MEIFLRVDRTFSEVCIPLPFRSLNLGMREKAMYVSALCIFDHVGWTKRTKLKVDNKHVGTERR